MFTVKECKDKEHACSECDGATRCGLCSRLGADVADGDRIFVMTEDGPIAVGVLGLKKGKVILKGVYGDISEQYRDLLNRSLLHVCRLMAPIAVRVESVDSYWRRFGFAECDGAMELLNTQIKF